MASPPARKDVDGRTGRPSGKQRLLDAAEALFSAHGFAKISAADIAREAAVAHGLLFHHFGSMENLYAEVSRAAVQRMDDVQLGAFRGATKRDQVGSFLKAHMRVMKQRQGDALFRARSYDVVGSGELANIWDASRQRAIDKVLEVLGVVRPSKKMRLCLRAWIAFYDQLVLGWLADGVLGEREVVEWSLRQLDHLAAETLLVDLALPGA